MIGIFDHSRSCRVTSIPSPSGSTRSMMAASGGRTEARSMRLLGGLGHDRVEPGLAQQHLQRAHYLRLVVADQHARPALLAHAGCSTGCSTGSSITKAVPCPGSDSAKMWPSLASTNPRAIARPRPAP